MKNSKGVSLISVVITIVVILIIVSITVYTGSNMLNQAREDRAKDKLDVIYQAIRSNEELLEIGDTASGTLDSTMYSKIGLNQFANDTTTTITYEKAVGGITDTSNTSKRTYTLSDGTYSVKKEYDVVNTTFSYAVDFDVIAGVNRPQLTRDMHAVNFAESSTGEPVKDIFLERWYSYDNSAPNYANMELNGEYYVWIPRFAYKIQSFYGGKSMPNVPDSAIDIIFINGTSNRDANGNVIPNGYIVHPAFTFGDKELAGFWIAKENTAVSGNISSAYTSGASKYNTTPVASTHMQKNVEWAAMAYLSQACGSATSSISSTGNNSGVMNVNDGRTEYIAAFLYTTSSALTSYGNNIRSADIKYKDIYLSPGVGQSFNPLNSDVRGDALIETSSGGSENSSWYNSISIPPTSEEPFIVRNTGDSVFGYTSAKGNEGSTYSRAVIIFDGI